MFPVTRPFRQTIATVALLLLTVVPTGFVAATAWRINRPGHVRDVEIELGRKLGLQVTLGGVHDPRPAETVYQGIVLRQEEPRGKGLAEIVAADFARLSRADHELTIHLDNPRVRADSPRMGLMQLGGFIQRSGQVPFERVNLIAPTCQLDLGGGGLRFELRDIAGEFLAHPAMPELRVAYRFAEKGSPTRCELYFSRDRRSDPIATTVVFKTIEGPPLPAHVLNMFFDAGDWLGPDAKLDGTLTLHQAGSRDWEAVFRGELVDIDLGKLVGRRFPRHRLSGRARLTIDNARWGERPAQGPGWIEVKGELVAGQGSIGVSLLESLAREMKFRLSPRLVHIDPRKTEIEFRALGLAFAMQSTGEIQITGSLGAEFPPDAVIAGPTTALLSAPQGTAGVHGLIKTLFPVAQAAHATMVPLTAESQVLLALPLPPGATDHARATVDGN
jgi:hypothetical protein